MVNILEAGRTIGLKVLLLTLSCVTSMLCQDNALHVYLIYSLLLLSVKLGNQSTGTYFVDRGKLKELRVCHPISKINYFNLNKICKVTAL